MAKSAHFFSFYLIMHFWVYSRKYFLIAVPIAFDTYRHAPTILKYMYFLLEVLQMSFLFLH